MFNDLVNQDELYYEALKYYANILTPFNKQVTKKIAEILALNLPVAMICPSHGIIWRQNPLQIVERYQQWAQNYQENQITIVYDTMWNGTRKMAEAIAAGIQEADSQVQVKLFNSARTDKNDILSEVFKAKGILVGSPTVNRGVLSSVGRFLEEIRGLSFKEKKAAAFGTYGWSGESMATITKGLSEAGFTIATDGLRLLWNPDAESLARCADFGKAFAISCQ